jgi:hypothetical protein
MPSAPQNYQSMPRLGPAIGRGGEEMFQGP